MKFGSGFIGNVGDRAGFHFMVRGVCTTSAANAHDVHFLFCFFER
jgi:hypothetical protein